MHKSKKNLKFYKKYFKDAFVTQTYKYRFFATDKQIQKKEILKPKLTLFLSEFTQLKDAQKAYKKIVEMLPPEVEAQNLKIEKKDTSYMVVLKNISNEDEKKYISKYLKNKYLLSLKDDSVKNTLKAQKIQKDLKPDKKMLTKLAYVYYRTDDFDNASAQLKQVEKTSKKTKDYKNQYYLDTIQNRKNDNVFLPYLSVGFGYDDSILDDLKIYTPKDNFNKTSSSYGDIMLSLGHIKGFEHTRYSYESVVDVECRHAFLVEDASFLNASILSGLAYRNIDKKIFAGLYLGYIKYNHGVSYNVFGIKPQFDYRITPTLRVLLEGSLLRYNDTSRENRDFDSQDIVFDITKKFKKDMLSGKISFTNIDKKTNTRRYIDRKMSSLLGIYSRAILLNLSATLNAGYTYVDYKGRNDSIIEFGTTILFGINDYIDVNLEYNYIKNNSNYTLYGYEKNTIEVNFDMHY
jgi:hypothetical protein